MRNISKVFVLAIVSLSSTLFAAELVEGEHYSRVSAQPSADKTITEFFNYGCAACYQAEDFIKSWKNNKPDTVAFELVPLELNASWEIYVDAYYIAEMLGILDKTHDRTFYRVHVEKNPITSKEELKSFYVSLGADPKRFDQAAASFQLATKKRKSRAKAISMRVTGTPSFVVNDHYKFVNGKFPNYQELFAGLTDTALLP